MDIRQLLGMLRHVHGPNASGEYTARCPGHDDKHASLSVTEKTSNKDGKRRIYLHDHGGCSLNHICSCLGITTQDLIVDPDPPGKGAGSRRGTGGQKKKPQKPAASDKTSWGAEVHQAVPIGPQREDEHKEEPEAKIDWAHPVAVYSYTDAAGSELYQVCRLRFVGAEGKTFRQRRYSPDNPQAKQDGYVWTVPAELYVPYHLPALMDAVRAGQTVYIVEGEKDVATVERFGLAATCNPGGAKKWRESYTEFFRGADVVILPDCDTQGNGYAGQEHAWMVANALDGVARRIRIPDLKAAYPKLKDKGDISDIADDIGDTAAKNLLAGCLASTRAWRPDDVKFWISPYDQAKEMYQKIKGVCLTQGGLGKYMADGSVRQLTTFIPYLRYTVTRSDGDHTMMEYVIDGWDRDGNQLDQIKVPAGSFDSMRWASEKWGTRAIVMTGQQTPQLVACLAKEVGYYGRHVMEYAHTGWRQKDGKWFYLYHGGAIGASGVNVALENGMDRYRLDGYGHQKWDEIEPLEGAALDLHLEEIMRPDIAVTITGATYLAPLVEFMRNGPATPAFAVFLNGVSQSRKTTVAALALSHFGDFDATTMPTNFRSTSKSIQHLAYLAKDALLVIDDYHPTTSAQEKKQMAATAQALARAFGDNSGRGRLNADGTMKATEPARCLALITGEDLPDISLSGLARFYVVDIASREDIPGGEDLTYVQTASYRGVFQKVMAGYIEWLVPKADTLHEKLIAEFIKYRDYVYKQGLKDRAANNVAYLAVGYQMMLQYFVSIGLVGPEEAAKKAVKAVDLLVQNSASQARESESQKPSKIFADNINELLASGHCGLVDLMPTEGEPVELAKNIDMIGYMDSDWYYFLPKQAYGSVCRACREQGTEFPVTLAALYKDLKASGYLIIDGMGQNTPTKNKYVKVGGKGKVCRLLWIPRYKLEEKRPEPKKEPQQMMIPVDPADLPDEWK